MIRSEQFVSAARERGFSFYSGVPCSYLKPFINHVIDSPQARYVAASNEGDAVAMAAGAHLAGSGGVAIFQNSGLGNAVNPLTSLTHTFRIPILIIVTLRAEPGGPVDEPQHGLMGPITTRMLEVMDIPWEYFPVEPSEIAPVLDRVCGYMGKERRPYALVMRKDSVSPERLAATEEVRRIFRRGCPMSQDTSGMSDDGTRPSRTGFFEALSMADVPRADVSGQALSGTPSATRRSMLEAYLRASRPNDIVVASTGFTGRELYALADRKNQFYMVGSMGCAVSLGLGLALAAGGCIRSIVLDGDGALLMRMGALAVVGFQRPENLIHVLLDNGRHESTGGQATVSHSIDFCAIAASCGYREVKELYSPADVETALRMDAPGPRFFRLPIVPGYPADLPRPAVTPEAVAERLKNHIASQTASKKAMPARAAESS